MVARSAAARHAAGPHPSLHAAPARRCSGRAIPAISKEAIPMNLAMADRQPLLADITGSKKLAGVVGLVALADWLFYGHPVGFSVLVFLFALDLGAILTNPIRANLREMPVALGVLAVAMVPLVLEPSLIAILFGAMGAAYVAVTATRRATDWRNRIVDTVVLLCDGSWQAASDLLGFRRAWSQSGKMVLRAGAITVWVVPAVLGAVFLFLFASANPLIEGWFAAIDLRTFFAHLSPIRIAFWLIMLSLVWPFIFMAARSRLRARAQANTERLLNTPLDLPVSEIPDLLFGKAAILRSLLLFNLLFAMQTSLDAAYLWGGMALPNGMTYASYAHRGAYPLIVTALLAAAFVIAAMRPGTEAERSPLIRNLVYLFVGQNVVLVISSMLRLDLYVEVLSLTYWRVAAFVWMVLVAVGLLLIVLRIALRRSNSWLVGMNLGSLAAILYVCGLVNFPSLIANYNVAHSREMSGQGQPLDVGYLLSLGPHALPALDIFTAQRTRNLSPATMSCLTRLSQAHLVRMQDWRAWSYRDWQLARYLRGAAESGRYWRDM
jgi:hypothetical protein